MNIWDRTVKGGFAHFRQKGPWRPPAPDGAGSQPSLEVVCLPLSVTRGATPVCCADQVLHATCPDATLQPISTTSYLEAHNYMFIAVHSCSCGAGLLNGSQFHGRARSERAHTPPATHRFLELQHTHRTWHSQRSHLLHSRCALHKAICLVIPSLLKSVLLLGCASVQDYQKWPTKR